MVLPGCTLIGRLVPVISVAMEDTGLPNDGPDALPEYLEEIVEGSQPSFYFGTTDMFYRRRGTS